MMTPFHLARLNLIRRRIPSLVALLSIAVSVAGSGVLLRLYRLSQARFASIAKGGDALIGAKAGDYQILLGALNQEGPYPGFIPYVLAESLQRSHGIQFSDGAHADTQTVRAAIPLVTFARFGQYRVIGTQDSFLNRPDPSDNLALKQGRWARKPGEIVLGDEVARAQNLKVGDSIAVAPWTGAEGDAEAAPLNVQIVGVLAATGSVWDRALFCDLTQAFNVLGAAALGNRSIWKGRVVHFFLLYLSPGGMDPLTALINQRSVAQLISIPDTRRRLEDLSGTGTRLGLVLCGLILLLGSLCVCAMMLTRFDAMLVQLAVLRALGYGKRHLSLWLLWEGLLLGVAACLLGALIDGATFPWLRSLLGSALPPPSVAHSALWQSTPVWILACVATLLACAIPLWRLFRQDVHAALKGM